MPHPPGQHDTSAVAAVARCCTCPPAADRDSDLRLRERLALELQRERVPARRAAILHEIGRITAERGDMTEACRRFLESLREDPSFEPSLWALRWFYVAEKQWPAVVDQLGQTAKHLSTRRRAESLLDRAWIQLDKLDDPYGACDSLLGAYAADPTWLSPLLTLEEVQLRIDDRQGLEQTYRWIGQTSVSARRRAAAARAQARLCMVSSDRAARPLEAIAVLEGAIDEGAQAAPLLAHAEVVSLVGRARNKLPGILTAIANRPETEPLWGAARLRAAAHLLWGRGDRAEASRLLRAALGMASAAIGREREAQGDGAVESPPSPGQAGGSLQSGLLTAETCIRHELADLSEQSGDNEGAIAVLSAGLNRVLSSVQRSWLLYRISRAQAALGRSAQAASSLSAAANSSHAYAPAFYAAERAALRQRDFTTLATLWGRTAARWSDSDGDRSRSSWSALCLVAMWHAAAGQTGETAELLLAPEVADSCDGERIAAALPWFPWSRPLPDGLSNNPAVLEEEIELCLLRRLWALPETSDETQPKVGERSVSVRCLERLWSRQPDDPTVARALFRELAGCGDVARLDAVLSGVDAKTLEPQTLVGLHISCAEQYRLAGQPHNAVTAYERALAIEPTDAYALCGLEELLRSGAAQSAALASGRALQRALAATSTDRDRTELSLTVLRMQALGRLEATQSIADLRRCKIDDSVEFATLRVDERRCRGQTQPNRLRQILQRQMTAVRGSEARAGIGLRLAEMLVYLAEDEQAAQNAITRAIATAPQTLGLWGLDLLAHLQAANGDLVGAAETLGRIELKQEDPLWAQLTTERLTLSALYGDGSGDETALSLCRELGERANVDVGCLWTAALFASRLGDAGLTAELNRALAVQTHDVALSVALNLRAAMLGTIADLQSPFVENCYRQVLDIQPDNLKAIVGLLGLSDLSGSDQCSLWLRLRDLVRRDVCDQLDMPVACSLVRAGQFTSALPEVQKLHRRQPTHVPTLCLVQTLAAALGEPLVEAQAWLQLAGVLSEASAKADAFRRAATLLAVAGRLRDAARALQQVIGLSPDDRHVWRELSAIYERSGDHDALERLLGHCIAYGTEGERAELHWKRARLRLGNAAKRRQGARDLLQVLSLEPDHAGATFQLGKLYEQDGAATRAIQLYLRCLAIEKISAETAVQVCRQLAALYERTDRSVEAVELCQRQLRASGPERSLLEQLAVSQVRLGCSADAIATFQKLAGLSDRKEQRARYLRQAALLYWHRLKDPHKAGRLLLEAQNLDTANIAIVHDLKRLHEQTAGCPEAASQPGISAKDVSSAVERARQELLRRLSRDGFSELSYRRLLKVAEWRGDDELIEGVLGALCALKSVDQRALRLYQRRASQRRLCPGYTLSEEDWQEALRPPETGGACAELWSLLHPYIDRIWPGRILGSKDWPLRSTARREHPVEFLVLDLAKLIGLSRVEVVHSDQVAGIQAGGIGQRGIVILGRGLQTGDHATARYEAGRALCLLRFGWVAVERLVLSEVELLLAAAIYLVERKALFAQPVDRVMQTARRLDAVLPRPTRRLLTLPVSRLLRDGSDVQPWRSAISAAADRAGLLACQNIVVAASRIGFGTEARRRRLADLLRVAVGDPFQRLVRAATASRAGTVRFAMRVDRAGAASDSSRRTAGVQSWSSGSNSADRPETAQARGVCR